MFGFSCSQRATPTFEEVEIDSESCSEVDFPNRLQIADEEMLSEMVHARYWECDICFEMHQKKDPVWSLGDERCVHSFCTRCLRESIRWGVRCPYDDTPISNLCACGVMAAGEFIHHVKRMRALETGNIMCSSEDCVGVVPAALDDLPQPVACQVCSKQNCARRTCGVPWTEGHRCWDVVAREQQQEAERIERMEELRREERRALAEWDMRHGRALPEDPTYIIQNRIASGPKVQPCPTCGVMVEHNGGCNMMYHTSCRTKWCFICLGVGFCSDYRCRSVESLLPQGSRNQSHIVDI